MLLAGRLDVSVAPGARHTCMAKYHPIQCSFCGVKLTLSLAVCTNGCQQPADGCGLPLDSVQFPLVITLI